MPAEKNGRQSDRNAARRPGSPVGQEGSRAPKQSDRQLGSVRHACIQAGRQADRQAGRQTLHQARQAGRQVGKQAGRQAGRQTLQSFTPARVLTGCLVKQAVFCLDK